MAQNEDSRDRDLIGTDHEKGQQEPRGSGEVSDEDMQKISGENDDRKTGQDHSLENYEDSEPSGGVGGVQDYSDTSSDIAHIEEE